MIQLHHVPGSRSFRVLWLLEELGLSADIQRYSLTDGGLRLPGFREKSPGARVPALEIDGTVIIESGAIVQYLCARQGRLQPTLGSKDWAAFLSWVHFAETQANIVQSLNIQHIFLRPIKARSPALMRLETRRLRLTIEALEQHLAGHDWLLPDFSGADCMMGFNLVSMFRFVSRDDFPAVAQYASRCRERPAFQRAAEKDGPSGLYSQEFYEIPAAAP